MSDKATQIARVKELATYGHTFLSPEGVKYFTEPFGFQGKTRIAKADASPDNPKGLILEDGATEAEGSEDWAVAWDICIALGLSPPSYLSGRGFRLRAACQQILEHLEGDDAGR
jgi:hypothetical protein